MRWQAFRRFLLTADAIQAHLLFGGLAVVLAYGLWADEAPPDAGWGLLFCVVAYPVVLGLIWCQKIADGQAAVEHLVGSLTAPEKLRRKRQSWRLGVLVFIAALAVVLYYAGKRGLVIEFIPAHYLGYCLMVLAVLGLAGVNIWHGGPLNPRLDPPLDSDANESE